MSFSTGEPTYIVNKIKESIVLPEIEVNTDAGASITVTDGTHTHAYTQIASKSIIKVEGFGTWTVTAAKDRRTKSQNVEISEIKRYSATLIFYKLYGYKISKSDSNPDTRVTYTDDAVDLTPTSLNTTTGALDLGGWADAWFVTGNKPLMQKYDGTVDYYLNPDDYTKKEDGVTASDVANTSYGGNAMAQFPTVWFKRWQDTDYEYCQMCDIQLTEDFHAYAHEREDGSVMEYFYRSLFDGCNVSNKIRSISGQTPCNTLAGGTQLSYAKANNPTGASIWNIDTWSRIQYIWDLLILMAKSTNVQTHYGYGQYTGFTSASNLAASGLGKTFGRFYGKGASNAVVKVFHCENIWGNVWKLCQGLVTNSSKQFLVKMKPPYDDTGAGSGYTNTNIVPTGTSGGYQSAHNVSANGRIPTAASGSESTYIPDGVWWAASLFLRFGGDGCHDLKVGCTVNCDHALSGSRWTFGVALSCEQPLT